MRSSVDGLVNPTLFVWSIGMTESTYVDHFRVSRINHDSADLASILQAHVRPRGAAVTGFVNSIAGRQVRANIRLASSRVDRLRIRWRHRDRPDRSHRLFVKDRHPDRASIRGFPDAAVDRAKIKSGRVARHSCHGDRSTSTEWADESPSEAVDQLRWNRLGNRGARK